MRALLDTSVLIAGESGRAIDVDRPAELEAAISIVTIGELQLGILRSSSAVIAATRARTLAEVERTYHALPVDRAVIFEFASLLAEARIAGSRPSTLDALIAATARAHSVPVYTQDADFDAMPGVDVVRV
ncbi:MAG: PIN domain-containing protein [Solirubrobacterales bacterium]